MKTFAASALMGAVALGHEHSHKTQNALVPVHNHEQTSSKFLSDQPNGACGDWETIDIHDNLYIMNNKWGKDTATGDSWQCANANGVDYKWVTAWGG